MKTVIVSRIFLPEPSAASFKLAAVARRFAEVGHDVTVLTTRPRRATVAPEFPGVRVKRAHVLRDKSGYVRGYLPYLSFDIPAFFRLLFRRRADLYFVEPPPTTGAVVRIGTWILRRPYFYDAADLWSDAARMATSSRLVIGLLRCVERFALCGASFAFAITEGLVVRMRELGIATPAAEVGLGADARTFRFEPGSGPASAPYFIYAGTYSEWHGAGIFVEAFAAFAPRWPGYRLVFVGNGSERDALRRRSDDLGLGDVEFREPVEGQELNPLLNGALCSLASLKPGEGYDYAFTTKLYASIAAGCPVIFSGVGPTGDFINAAISAHAIGAAVPYDVAAVTAALDRVASKPVPPSRRRELSAWARENFSLEKSAETIVRTSIDLVANR